MKRFRLGLRQGERKPKIVIGALNPGMLALAGEIADGVLLNYLPASHVPWSIEQVRKGGDAEVYAYVHVGVADREAAVENARKDLFSYAVVDAYARNFERAGFADEVAEIRGHHAAKDREGALAAVSDRMVDAIDVVGDAAHVSGHDQGLRRQRRRPPHRHAPPLGRGPPPGHQRHPAGRRRGLIPTVLALVFTAMGGKSPARTGMGGVRARARGR